MKENNFQICSRCVLDTTVKDIKFDDEGNCNYCTHFLERSSHIINRTNSNSEEELVNLITNIKKNGKNKPYDCIVGVSGGVDSSWAIIKAKEYGLRPLAVHMDNGWNSELAQNNIENLIKILDVDLYTHVIDWSEYKSLMQAFFDADVIDVELLYDNAMLAVNYQLANKYGIKYILSGGNQITEGIKTPSGWNWFKKDKKNIKAIAKKFGKVKLKSFPAIGTLDFVYFEFFKKISWVSFLDYFDFNKQEALNVLQEKYSYKPYPFKHYESIFTRFYQGYLLPEKFNVDKRRLHFSALIISNQMKRDDALNLLKEIPYASNDILNEDKSYFLKKMGWTSKDLSSYLKRKEKPHLNYSSEQYLWNFLLKIHNFIFKKNKI